LLFVPEASLTHRCRNKCSTNHNRDHAGIKWIVDFSRCPQVIYGESQSKLPSEERPSSDATAELIELHLKRIKKSWLFTKGRDHGGTIENTSLYLRYWQELIQRLKLSRTSIEKYLWKRHRNSDTGREASQRKDTLKGIEVGTTSIRQSAK